MIKIPSKAEDGDIIVEPGGKITIVGSQEGAYAQFKKISQSALGAGGKAITTQPPIEDPSPKVKKKAVNKKTSEKSFKLPDNLQPPSLVEEELVSDNPPPVLTKEVSSKFDVEFRNSFGKIQLKVIDVLESPIDQPLGFCLVFDQQPMFTPNTGDALMLLYLGKQVNVRYTGLLFHWHSSIFMLFILDESTE